jgi:hypothetical protein
LTNELRFKIKGEKNMSEIENSPINPFYGVKGWLKMLIVVNLYIAPVIFVIRYIMGWIDVTGVANRYPGLVLVLFLETLVGGFFIWKFIQMAKDLRDIKPGVVQEVKKWLKLNLGWIILDAPLSLISGIDAEYLLPSMIKGIILGIVGFAIWYSYFNVSKRVKATYPDWNAATPD